MEDRVYAYLALLLAPIVSLVSWIVSRRKRKLSSIEQLQSTVDMLLQQNQQLISQIIELRKESVDLNKEFARVTSLLSIEQMKLYREMKKNDNLTNRDEEVTD